MRKYKKSIFLAAAAAVLALVLEGGNHAGFGCYGTQEGDGTSSLEPGAQQSWTADTILEFILEP